MVWILLGILLLMTAALFAGAWRASGRLLTTVLVVLGVLTFLLAIFLIPSEMTAVR